MAGFDHVEHRWLSLFDRSDDQDLFSKADLAWLLAESVTKIFSNQRLDDGIPIGTSITFHGRFSQPRTLILSHGRRLLLLKLFASRDETLLQAKGGEPFQPGFDLLCELLLTTGDRGVRPLRDMPSADVKIILTSLHASELGLLLYHCFSVHASIQELDLLPREGKWQKFPCFHPLELAHHILGAQSMDVLRTVEVEGMGKAIWSVRVAMAAWKASERLTRPALHLPSKVLESAIVDTKRVPSSLIDIVAGFTYVQNHLIISKPKKTVAHLTTSKMDDDDDDDGTGSAAVSARVLPGKKCKFEVLNEQYKNRLMPSFRQKVEVCMNVEGEEELYAARTLKLDGKKSVLQFTGKEALEAFANLSLHNGDGSQGRTYIQSIRALGREDVSIAENQGKEWRRELMCKSSAARDKLDQAGLLFPLLFGTNRKPTTKAVHIDTIRALERPWSDDFHVLTKLKKDNKLNLSQRQAARAILSPMTERYGSGAVELKERERSYPREIGDRLIIVHGPPGTGKTSLISACCQQFAESCNNEASTADLHVVGVPIRDAIYACCQSNVAVKNIAESLCKSGIVFRIIVSRGFFVDWHEDLYNDIWPFVILSSELPPNLHSLHDRLGSCDVILSTVDFLSSPHVDRGLLTLRPMRILMIDEASQIHLRFYPQLFARFGNLVGRVVFMGDDEQLAPFNSEGSSEARTSVFELDHLRKKAFLLNRCYRLPRPMVLFISDQVYGGQLSAGKCNFDPPGGLLDCVAFVDVQSGEAVKRGTSHRNQAEVNAIHAIVKAYKERGGDLLQVKVLATYDAQRDAIQDTLSAAGLCGGAADMVFNVDAFQGRQSDCVILSLVRDGRKQQPDLGFLQNQRRVNVALTRARRSLLIVSSRRFINNVACDTLIGKLERQIRLSKAEQEMRHWMEEDDVLRGRLPEHVVDAIQSSTKTSMNRKRISSTDRGNQPNKKHID